MAAVGFETASVIVRTMEGGKKRAGHVFDAWDLTSDCQWSVSDLTHFLLA